MTKTRNTDPALALSEVEIYNVEAILETLEAGGRPVIYQGGSSPETYPTPKVTAKVESFKGRDRLIVMGDFTLDHAIDSLALSAIRNRFSEGVTDMVSLYDDVTFQLDPKRRGELTLSTGASAVRAALYWFGAPNDRDEVLRFLRVTNHRPMRKKSSLRTAAPEFNPNDPSAMAQNMADFMQLLSVADQAFHESIPPEAYTLSLKGVHRRARVSPPKDTSPTMTQHRDLKGASPVVKIESKIEKVPKNEVIAKYPLFEHIHGLSVDDMQELRMRAAIFKDRELAEYYDVATFGGLLFHGEPGTGKTMAAQAFANEIGGELWDIDSSMIDKWVGGSAKNTKAHFEKAIKASEGKIIVLKFDEFDSIHGSKNNRDNERIAALGELKRQLETLPKVAPNIVVIATTNNPDDLDDAVKRSGRFDTLIHFSLPDDFGREAIFIRQIDSSGDSQHPMFDNGEIDYGELARASDGLSGADIELVVKKARAAMFYAHTESGYPGPITQEDLLREIRRLRKQ